MAEVVGDTFRSAATGDLKLKAVGDRRGSDATGVSPRSRSHASPPSTHEGSQPMPKAPRPKRKDDVPSPVGTLSKYFPIDSIPSDEIKHGPPPPDPAQEEEAERSFLSHNDEGGFRTFANLYTMAYLAKPKLVQGVSFPPSQILNN